MEKTISSQCKQLLGRIKLSSAKYEPTNNRVQQQQRKRLWSLSVYKRKINNSLGQRQQQNSQRKAVQRLLIISDQRPQKFRPELNLRKGTRIQATIQKKESIRKPFSNLTNMKRVNLKIQSQNNQKNEKTLKMHKKHKVQTPLLVYRLINKICAGTLEKNLSNKSLTNSQRVDQQNNLAIKNASLVNEIFSYLNAKSSSESQKISQFTQILFKLVFYFFVSKITQYQPIDKIQLIQFVQKEILGSYNTLKSIKRQSFKKQNNREQDSNNTIFSNQQSNNSVTSQMNISCQKIGVIVRKQKRVNSFFRTIDSGGDLENSTMNQKQNNENQNLSNAQNSKVNGTSSFQIQQEISKKPLKNKLQENSPSSRKPAIYNSIKQDKKQYSYSNSNTNTEERSDVSSKQINSMNSKSFLPQCKFQSLNTRRKSCFITQTKGMQGPLGLRKTSNNLMNLPNIQNSSKSFQNTLQINMQSKVSKPRRMSTFSNFNNLASNSNLMIGQSNQRLSSKQVIKSKGNLNLSTPYDFHKQDTLMTKRIKYLQLHQQIILMTQNLQELKNEESHITNRISEKDSQLIAMQNHIENLQNQIEEYSIRNRDAENYLNGPQCPQIAQKIIKKKGQIQKNLKSLINYNAWYSTNLAQSSHIQNIVSTKQSSLQNLNLITRKLRGCKNIQQIQNLVSEMREMFLITTQKYSQIIHQLQDKIKQTEQSRSNMLKNLEDWEMESKIKEKLVNNSFLDYYSVQRKVSIFIQKMPQSLKKLQNIFNNLLEERRKQIALKNNNKPGIKTFSKNNQKLNSSQNQQNNLSEMESEAILYLNKMKTQNDAAAKQLYKQKKFAMILEKIV